MNEPDKNVPTPTQSHSQPRKLYRSKTNRKIAGICGGIGEYFDVDPTIVRIIFIILLLPGGLPGLLPYIILWVIVPDQPSTTTTPLNEPGE